MRNLETDGKSSGLPVLPDLAKVINKDLIRKAIINASKGHRGKKEIKEMINNIPDYIGKISDLLQTDSYKEVLKYRDLTKTNNNGKTRHIHQPDLITRVLQHYWLCLVLPIYRKHDNLNGVNCKEGCGISATSREKSLIKKMKHVVYDRRDLEYCLIIDQRKCYSHIKPKIFRKEAKRIIKNHWIIDFGIDIGFIGGALPIGTPTSPVIHHIVMLSFDHWCKQVSPFSLRYADDNLLMTRTKEDAVSLSWRVQNYWWYNLQVRAKVSSIRIQPVKKAISLCGYVFHRNSNSHGHNKGYTTVRKNISKSAKKCNNNLSWGSYFGILRHADCYRLARKIEDTMKLRQLTDKIKISRNLDAPNIPISELEGTRFTIYGYDIRCDRSETPNWVKCLIGVEEKDEDGKLTGRILAREFHGGYQYLAQFLSQCETDFGKEDILPIEDVSVENQCGYIFTDSTNQIKYIV